MPVSRIAVTVLVALGIASGCETILGELFGERPLRPLSLEVATSDGQVTLTASEPFAGIACGTSPGGGEIGAPPGCDFVTGGGWITGTPSGAKANFGLASGIKKGALGGHLNYVDHGNGLRVKATAVTGYAIDPNDTDCRIIDYNVTIDGQPGTGRVRACDKGEPGGDDIFQIQLSNGYFAGGDLGGGDIHVNECQ